MSRKRWIDPKDPAVIEALARRSSYFQSYDRADEEYRERCRKGAARDLAVIARVSGQPQSNVRCPDRHPKFGACELYAGHSGNHACEAER